MQEKIVRIKTYGDFIGTINSVSSGLVLEQKGLRNPVELANLLEKSIKDLGTDEELLMKTFLEIPDLKTLEKIDTIFAKFPALYSYRSVSSLINAELGFFDQKIIDEIKKHMDQLKVTNDFLQKQEESRLKDEKVRKTAEESIKLHEGIKYQIYRDSRKNLSIGIGMNLERSDSDARLKAVGANPKLIRSGKEKLNNSQIQILFKQDIDKAIKDAKSLVPDLGQRPLPVQCVLIEMAFNLGKNKLSGFKKFLFHIQNRNYELASREMLNSIWAKQVGDRAKKLAKRIETYEVKK
jgi:lysozyme